MKHVIEIDPESVTDMASLCRYYTRVSGGHWFQPATMRFFRSRVYDPIRIVPGGWLFVSSEVTWGPRVYTVRHMDHEGEITTCEPGLGAFPSLKAARKHMGGA